MNLIWRINLVFTSCKSSFWVGFLWQKLHDIESIMIQLEQVDLCPEIATLSHYAPFLSEWPDRSNPFLNRYPTVRFLQQDSLFQLLNPKNESLSEGFWLFSTWQCPVVFWQLFSASKRCVTKHSCRQYTIVKILYNIIHNIYIYTYII